jgi:D-glycero-D-manno-heptose 1,7-bisphosphate phosphatase
MRAVFLDRDGVLNASGVRDGRPYPPKGLDDLHILDEARLGCALLREAGFKLVCITNQPDIARGSTDQAAVDQINAKVASELALDQVRVCPHDDADDCACRKPRPGLILDAAAELGIDLTRSFMIGDRWRDIDAGRAAGCATVFIDRGYRERPPAESDFVARSTLEASRWIVAHDPTGLERH